MTPAERLKELEERFIGTRDNPDCPRFEHLMAERDLNSFKEAIALIAANVPAEGELTPEEIIEAIKGPHAEGQDADWELAIVSDAASAKMAAFDAARYGALVDAARLAMVEFEDETCPLDHTENPCWVDLTRDALSKLPEAP